MIFEKSIFRIFLGIALTFSFSLHAQSINDIAPGVYRDLTSPYDEKLVAHFFGPAVQPAGEEVHFAAKGAILLHIHRGSTSLPSGATVTVTVNGERGDVLASWATELNPVTTHGFIKRVDLPANASSVSVRVIDRAEGGPTKAPPYTLVLEVWPLTSTSLVTLIEGLPKKQKQATSSCRFVSKTSLRPDYFEEFGGVGLRNLPVNVAVQRLVTAGGYLLLSLPPDAEQDTVVSVSLFAKPSGDGPFKRVCTETLRGGSGHRVFEVTQPNLDQYAVWRLELTLRAGTKKVNDGARLLFGRQRLLVVPDPLRANADWNNSQGLICFDRSTNRLGEVASNNRFAGRTRLNVTVPSAGSVMLSDRQRSAVEATVLQAATLWVRSCVVCRPDNLSIISLNGKVFVANDLYLIGGPPRGVGPSPPLNPDKVEEQLKMSLGGARIGVGSASLPYRAAQSAVGEFKRLCSLEASKSTTPTLQRIQNALCRDKPEADLVANIRVSFKDTETACGAGSDIIGCRADHELTQYNVRDFRFTTRLEATSIGGGAVEVDLLQVVLHEMGHWIGLGHVDSGESIMASSLEKARCIDFDTVKAIAELIAVVEAKGENDRPQAFRLRASRRSKYNPRAK